MRTFWKKSSLAFLLAVLVLLTGVLVGTAVTAASEELDPTYEATFYNENGSIRDFGTHDFETIVAKAGQLYDGLKGTIVLHQDIELTSAIEVKVGRIAKIDGQGHTIYISDELKASQGTFISVSNNSGATDTVVFKNIKFDGQAMGWDGTDPVYYGSSGSTVGAFNILNAHTRFEMIGCSMQNFYANGRAICITAPTHSAEYYPNAGIYLTDTVITNNHSANNGDGYFASAIRLAVYGNPAVDTFGAKIHVSGNTKVINNYNGSGQPTANIGVQQAQTEVEGVYNGSTVVIVEEDFTGEIHLVKCNQGNMAHTAPRRGLVFFRGSSYNEKGDYTRAGIVYGATWTTYAKAATGELVNFCGDDTTIQGTWLTTTSTNPCVATALVGDELLAFDSFGAAITSGAKEVNVYCDIDLSKSTSTFPVNSNMTVNFNGHTVTRSTATTQLIISSGGNITIKNANFAGAADSGSYLVSINAATAKFEDCTFTNWDGGAIYTSATMLTLEDVIITGSGKEKISAVEVKANTAVYVGGDTQIYIEGDYTNNRINGYNTGASIGISSTFTGRVVFDQWGYSINRATFYMCDRSYPEDSAASNYSPSLYRHDYCTVAEGAEVIGKIYSNNQAGYVAINNCGTLIWTKVGQTIPTNKLTVLPDANDPTKLYAQAWYYNNGTEDVATTKVVDGVYNYFVKNVEITDAEAYAVDGNGKIAVYGSFGYVLSKAIDGYTVEVIRDVVIPAGQTSINPAAYTVNLNGKTIGRADKTARISLNGAKGNVVFKNGHFSGKVGGEHIKDAYVFFDSAYAILTFDNCTFADFDTSGGTEGRSDGNMNRGSAIRMRYEGSLYLKDVTITDSPALYGAVYCFNTINAGAQAHIYVEGNTTITGGGTKIHLGTQGSSTLNVSGDFTGTVAVKQNASVALNGFVRSYASAQEGERAISTVAEGAKIKGTIYPDGATSWFAYNSNGALCWTQAGSALPVLAGAVVDENDESTLIAEKWFYLKDGVETATDVSVAGEANYYTKVISFSPEAYIVRDGAVLTYGDFKPMVGQLTTNDVLEVAKDVTGLKNVYVAAAATIDGNGHTLTMAIEPDAAEAYYMFTLATTVTFRDVVIHGGAAEVGVWDGALYPVGTVMFKAGGAYCGKFYNTTITGFRTAFASADSGTLFAGHWGGSGLYFEDVSIVDNFVQLTAHISTNGSAGVLIRMGGSAAVFAGKIVFKDNYVYGTDGNFAPNNYGNVNVARTHVNQLDEGSELHFWRSGTFTMGLNEAGTMPVNNTGKIFWDGRTAMTAEDIANGKTYWGDNYGILWSGNYTASNYGAGATVELSTSFKFNSASSGYAGEISSDKLMLNHYASLSADNYRTRVIITVNGKELSNTTLDTYGAPDTNGRYVIPVALGMAELADEVVITFMDGETKLGEIKSTARGYATTLIGMTDAAMVEAAYASSAEQAATMKGALASLLQYGAKVQTFFKHNTAALAMTADEEAAWLAAGYIEEIGNGLAGGTSVQAQEIGSVNGVATYGATLTMENQMSLRLYFTAASLEGLTFTVDGEEVTPIEANGMYYIEAAHIGTASLAKAVNFVIASETESITYTASPMSYVFAVFAFENDAVTAELKDACEALYYYFVATGAHFGFSTDIGFATALSVSVDPVNSYSIPYGIKAA